MSEAKAMWSPHPSWVRRLVQEDGSLDHAFAISVDGEPWSVATNLHAMLLWRGENANEAWPHGDNAIFKRAQGSAVDLGRLLAWASVFGSDETVCHRESPPISFDLDGGGPYHGYRGCGAPVVSEGVCCGLPVNRALVARYIRGLPLDAEATIAVHLDMLAIDSRYFLVRVMRLRDAKNVDPMLAEFRP